MIKKLQKQFILVTTLSLIAVMIFVLGTINLIYKLQTDQQTDEVLQLLSENDGTFPEQMLSINDNSQVPDLPDNENNPASDNENNSISDDENNSTTDDESSSTADDESSSTTDDESSSTADDENNPAADGEQPEQKEPSKDSNTKKFSEETAYETRYFTVRANEKGTIMQVDTANIAAVTSEEAQEYAETVLESEKTSGYLGIYKYLVTDTELGKTLIFMDCQSELQSSFYLMVISVFIGVFSVLIVFIIVFFFSKKATRPVAESFEKQKQFITDASHELKTPIAIISANNDVLELTQGANEWTESIHHQTDRLSGLVKDMLMLSRMNEENTTPIRQSFSISELAEKTVSAFSAPAAQQNKEFLSQITPNLSYLGDEDKISQLMTILCDNALKYSPEGSKIYLSLTAKGKNILLTVKNTCSNMPEGNLNRLFDRFYRTDASRSRETGGYGIGLSIAKAIVNTHKGKIYASKESDDIICFTVLLS